MVMKAPNIPVILADYERDGVALVRGFLSTDEVRAIRAELDRYIREDLASKPADARTYEADETTVRNLWRLEVHNEFFRDFAARGDLRDLIAVLVKGEPVLAGVETFNKPARIGSGVPPHQDNAYFCQTPPDMLTVWIAIASASPECRKCPRRTSTTPSSNPATRRSIIVTRSTIPRRTRPGTRGWVFYSSSAADTRRPIPN